MVITVVKKMQFWKVIMVVKKGHYFKSGYYGG